MNKLLILILVALILCALFYGLTFFELPWTVFLFSGNTVQTIVGIILGICVAHLIYYENNEDDER